MPEQKIPNKALVEAGLALMDQSGQPLRRLEARGRAMLFATHDGETVRVRTCNDHVLVVVATTVDATTRLNVEGTDKLLIVMPEVARTAGPVVAFLVPTNIVLDAVRTVHGNWKDVQLSGDEPNRTFNISFDDGLSSNASGLAKEWAKHRLHGRISTTPPTALLAVATYPTQTAKLGDVIAEARRRIAGAAGVLETAVKIIIET